MANGESYPISKLRRSTTLPAAKSSPKSRCAAPELVNEAVEAAAAAFPAWRETPPVERARLFFRYRQLVEENFDHICQLVTREHGKTLAEARGSAYRGIENIEYACGIPDACSWVTRWKIWRAASIARRCISR